MRAIEGSLRRLGTDWLDVYMIHWPDYGTPIDETLRALDDLVRDGKVRYVACSNLETWRVVDALRTSRHHGYESFICAQSEYSLLNRDAAKDLIPALAHYGAGFIPYRSEERRVGEECVRTCRYRWSRDQYKKKKAQSTG